MNRELRILFAGGGTGGHVFPAIYIARYLKQYWGARCEFIGTSRGIESIKVPQAGFVLHKIWISGFKRGLYISNLVFPLKLIISLWQSRRKIKYFKPDIVVGTGGYVSGPVLYQASKMKIATAIQEQNSYPGITTRLLSGRVDLVLLAYKEALGHIENLPQYRIIGNPVQIDIKSNSREEARKFFNLDKRKTTILVFGGSQGARNINSALDRLLDRNLLPDVQIIWQTGQNNFEETKSKYQNFDKISLCILPFIDRMDMAYAASDFAICRAGAMTISELASAGLPAILVPLPGAAADHQLKNAQSVAKMNGAIVVQDKPEMDEFLLRAINRLRESPDELSAMSLAIGKFYQADALEMIAKELKSLYDSKNKDQN